MQRRFCAASDEEMTNTMTNRIMKSIGPLAGSMLLVCNAWAGFGDAKQTLTNADRQLVIQVAKCSVKGEKAGWISGADKSLECSGVDSGGKSQSFSALETQHDTLMSHANQWVRILLINKRLENASTDWALLRVEPISPPVKMEKACEVAQRLPADKVDSSGFRMVRVVDMVTKGEPYLKGYVGSIGGVEWGFEKKAPVEFPPECNAAIQQAMGLFEGERQVAVAMEYIQEDLDRKYEVFRVWLPQGK